MPKIVASIRLTNTIPPSNKEYRVQITDNGDGTYNVDGFNGRIGGNLTRQPQEDGRPLSRERATAIYQMLVDKKTRNGYVPDPGSTGSNAITTVVKERTATGLIPQLLNEITREAALRLIDDAAFGLQIKEDGENLIVRSLDGIIVAANKKGIETQITDELRDTLLSIPGEFEIAGEIVGNSDGTTTYHVFDLMAVNGRDKRNSAYQNRYSALTQLLSTNAAPSIALAPLYRHEDAKWQAFAQAEALEREGVVFKRLSATYRAGRPSSGGDQLKFKFIAELSALVAGINARDSVSLELIANGNGYAADGGRVAVGNVKINGAILTVGDVVEVRYLYMKRAGGALYQPRLKSNGSSPRRTDVDADECTTAQIKYKGVEAITIS